MIYLDNSATTQPYSEVLKSFLTVSNDYFGNPSSIHKIGSKAEDLLNQARNHIAMLLNVKSSEIIFTSGGTEGNNLAIKGAALRNKRFGKHIITTSIEHPSVHEACRQLEKLGFNITYLPVNQKGIINLEDLKNAIQENTILVSIIHVNNEVGAIQPIYEIGQLLKNYPNILFHVDHIQGICKVPLDFQKANIHLATMSAHKFHGLKGNGILYVREGVNISPLMAGGGQEFQLRSGTENVAGIVAMAKALRITTEKSKKHLLEMLMLKNEIMNSLEAIPDISLNTPKDESAPHIINFSILGLKTEVFVHALGEKGIYVSTTSACSSKKKVASTTLLAMGKDLKTAENAIRISLSYDNKQTEAAIIMKEINQAIEKIKEVMR